MFDGTQRSAEHCDLMAEASFSAQTLDDVLRDVTSVLLRDGKSITNTKGSSVELFGVLLEITDPRARLSRTETRGKPFSCLGELCWYLSKTSDLDFIKYYLSEYVKSADGDRINGAYGPRLFNWNGIDQFQNVVDLLTRKRSSRQAVVQLFGAQDILAQYNDVPCTCSLQFVVREEKLYMMTTMRSNDVYKGLPHDVFCFTMLQEIMARLLKVELGVYKHAVGSMHLYDSDRQSAQQFLREGWQSTETSMPPMPLGDPWPSVAQLLNIEGALRADEVVPEKEFSKLLPYWADLARLLQVLRYRKNKKAAEINRVRPAIDSNVYLTFVDKARIDVE